MNKLNEIEVGNLFAVFLDNCDNQMLRQTVSYNSEPEAVEAARRVLAYRKQDNAQLRNWRARLSCPLDEPFERGEGV